MLISSITSNLSWCSHVCSVLIFSYDRFSVPDVGKHNAECRVIPSMLNAAVPVYAVNRINGSVLTVFHRD